MQPILRIEKADPPHPHGLPWYVHTTQPGFGYGHFHATFTEAITDAHRWLRENRLDAAHMNVEASR